MNILYFAPIPFEEIKQRPQCIAEELSKCNKIYYVEPTVSLIRCLVKGGNEWHRKEKRINENLHVLRLSGGFNFHEKMKIFDILGLGNIQEKLQIKHLVKWADIIWIGYEGWYRLFLNDCKSIIVFDKMDDNVALTQNILIKMFLKKMRQGLEKRSNIIFVTAQKFYEDLKKNQNVFLIPNGVAFEKSNHDNIDYRNKGKKRFGYIGMISHWFDIEAIKKLALENPESEIILVGPNYQPVINLPNVFYYGKVPKEQVDNWINTFDICLYPFKKSDLLDTIDPVKIYEYLSCNKPIIAIHSKEMEKYDRKVYVYDSIDELIQLSHQTLTPPFRTEEERDIFFKENSWANRVKNIVNILEEELQR